MKYSIIIPVHNAEAYLSDCIDSIFSQSAGDFEVIFVVNGSSDGSEDICLTARECHSNIRVIVTDAIGVSSARNIGLRQAHGEYVIFVDADDMLLEGAFSVFDKATSDHPDIVTANYVRNKKKSMSGRDANIESLPYARAILDAPAFYKAAHTKLTWQPLVLYCVFAKAFKRSFLSENGILFDTDLAIGEDLSFSLSAVLAASSVRTVDTAVYYYRPGEQTVSSIKDISAVTKRLASADKLYAKVDTLPEEVRDAARMKVIDILLRSIVIAASCGKDRKAAYESIQKFLRERKMGKLFARCRKGSLSMVSADENLCYMKMADSLREGRLYPAFRTAEDYHLYLQKKDRLKMLLHS